MLTNAQKAALDLQGHIWVHASAGTGKTFVLIYRIFRLLLAGEHPQYILALTFTQNAAQEMLERLYGLLERIAKSPETCLTEVMQCLGYMPDALILQRARGLWSKILDQPPNIQTLHGFCQNILYMFPLEAGVSNKFSVLDESRSYALWIEQQEHVLSTFYSASPNISASIDRLGKRYTMHHITAQLKFLWNRSERVVFPTGHEVPSPVHPPKPLSPIKLAELQRYISHENLRCDISSLFESWENKNYTDFFLTQQGTPRKILVTQKLPEVLRSWLYEAQFELCQALQQKRREDAFQDTQDFCHIFCEIRKHYTQKKAVQGVLDFSDLIEKTITLLQSPQYMGWVYAQLDRIIHHVLIDEAQDTSPMQWQVMKLLSEVWSASPQKTVFVVGDPKQSIYSFQGANLKEFFTAKYFFKHNAFHASLSFKEIDLTDSFRSHQYILDLVNHVFQNDTIMEFKPHTALQHQQGGHVELWPILPSKTEQSNTELLANLWVKKICNWLDTPFKLRCTGRFLNAQDIMILVSKRCSLYEAFAQALRSRGLRVAEKRSVCLQETMLIQDIMALIQWLIAPQDDWSLAQILKSPFFSITEEELFYIAQKRNNTTLWEYLETCLEDPWRMRYQQLSEWRKVFTFSTPFQFIQWLVYTPSMRSRYAFWKDTTYILDTLLAHIFSFCQEQGLSWSEWVHMFTAHPIMLKQDTEEGIRLLTIHGAKGLQAPIVILPDLSVDSRTRDAFIFTEKGPWKLGVLRTEEDTLQAEYAQQKAQEERRLLYVAMTRAQERLYCSSLSNTAVYQEVKDALRELAHPIPFEGDYALRYCDCC